MVEKERMYSMKEVFEKTGLNRRQVFEFQDVVPPAKRKQVGLNHNEGYKYYDDDGLKKLQIISIFRQLNVPNVDIKRRMRVSPFNSEEILTEQIERLKEERKRIDDCIKLAETLLLIGTDPDIVDMFVNREKLELMGVDDILDTGIDDEKWQEMIDDLENILNVDEQASVDKILGEMESYLNDVDKCYEGFQRIVEIYQRKSKGFWAVIRLSNMGTWLMGNGEIAREMLEGFSYDEADTLKHIVEGVLEKTVESIMDIADTYIIRIGKLYKTDYTIESVKNIMRKMNEAVSKKYSISDEICIYYLRSLMLSYYGVIIRGLQRKEEKDVYGFVIEMLKEHYAYDLLTE